METELQLALGYIDTFAGNGKARSTGDGKRGGQSRHSASPPCCLG